jgi:glycosyltransferase involved in cell wall biosynthesis
MPRVSVVVSHYQRQAELCEALQSIARQSFQDFEVIVVNDHGADSRGLVSEFAARLPGFPPSRVRYDYRARNGGVAATRNRGIALASGELIAYLDDDDLWRPCHLERLVAALDAEPDAALAYGDAAICRMERDPACGAWTAAAQRTLAVPFDRTALGRDDFIVPGGMLHRRALIDAIGGYDESLPVSDDWDWLLRASAVSRFVRVPEIVIAVRIWADGGNLSARCDAARLAALAELARRHGLPPLEPKTFWEVAATYAPAAP